MRSCPSTIDTVPSFPVNRLPAVTRTSRTFCRGERRLLFRRRYEINYGGKFSRHDEPAEGLILFVSVFIKRILQREFNARCYSCSHDLSYRRRAISSRELFAFFFSSNLSAIVWKVNRYVNTHRLLRHHVRH